MKTFKSSIVFSICAIGMMVSAFHTVPSVTSSSLRRSTFVPIASSYKVSQRRSPGSSTQLSMFLGQDSGILGVGAPELAVIVLVGYFLLGPEELYKLTKEIGKFITNVRSVATETTANFQDSMEENLQLKEIQKAQAELNDAFNFRRSINFDEDSVETELQDSREVEAAKATAAAVSKGKKKKIRRKKKVVQPQPEPEPESEPIPVLEDKTKLPSYSDDVLSAGETGDEWYKTASEIKSDVPDLDMSDAFDEKTLEEQRRERLMGNTPPASERELTFEEKMAEQEAAEAAQARFAAQLNGDWNQTILDNDDKLSPMAAVMDRLALLEDERAAAEARLEEEFRLKAELEEKYYRQKRALLESAANEIQAQAYQATEKIEEKTNVDTAKSTK